MDKKTAHSLSRPLRSDFVQLDFPEPEMVKLFFLLKYSIKFYFFPILSLYYLFNPKIILTVPLSSSMLTSQSYFFTYFLKSFGEILIFLSEIGCSFNSTE